MPWINCLEGLKERADEELLLADEQFGLPHTVVVIWNNQLKTAAGRAYYQTGTVELNPDYFREFGEEKVITTLRHELAHLMAYKSYGDNGHGTPFKQICRRLGGDMNEQLAANGAPECASKEYIRSEYKWEYRCPDCGSSFKKKRRISAKVISTHVCSYCKCSLRNFHCWKL